MPHYADGTEAKVGDQVSGKLFNSDGIKAGVIVSITPGTESCNCQVQFTEVVPAGDKMAGTTLPRMVVLHEGLPLTRRVRGEKHGTEGASFIAAVCVDYCDVNKLTKIV